MLISAGEKEYRVIREVFTSKINDIYICQNIKEPKAPFKTLWIVKDRMLIRTLMKSMSEVCEEKFMQNENAGFVFSYREERPLFRFYPSTIKNGSCAKGKVLLELVVKCMTAGIPSEILNLIIKQDQINIGTDGSIYFGFFLDLSEYDEYKTEKDNVSLCANIIVELSKLEKNLKNNITVGLLSKKLNREKYHDFFQLYQDIKLILQEQEPENSKEKIKKIVQEKQDSIYKVLSMICIILIFITIFFLIGHFVFGEFSFWKLFNSSFEVIGTESLLQ